MDFILGLICRKGVVEISAWRVLRSLLAVWQNDVITKGKECIPHQKAKFIYSHADPKNNVGARITVQSF